MNQPTPGPEDPLAASKRALRARVRRAVAELTPGQVAERSERLCERLIAADFFVAARSIMLYAPMPGEADITPVILLGLQSGRRVCIPRVDWASRLLTPALVVDPGRDLVAGPRGVREPGPHAPEVPASELDLVLAPGVAFDLAGGRLGRGAGFYDRFLSRPDLRALACGVGFEAQVVGAVPMGSYDARLHALATEDRVVRFA